MRFWLFVLFVVVLTAASARAACPLCAIFDGACCGGGDAASGDAEPVAADGTPTFRRQGGKWPQPAGLGSPVTLTYSYNNLLDGGIRDIHGESLPIDFIRASVEEALGLWASVAPLHFVEVEDEGGPVRTSAYPNGQFGQIRFNHRFINGPDPPVGQPTTKAQAHFPATGGNLGGDVFYDNGDPWSQVGMLSQPDILGATIHELGHSLGLGHDSNPDANMYWIFTRTPGLGTGALHFSDIAGIQSIYGEGVGSVTPLVRVPEPAGVILALAGALVAWVSRPGRVLP